MDVVDKPLDINNHWDAENQEYNLWIYYGVAESNPLEFCSLLDSSLEACSPLYSPLEVCSQPNSPLKPCRPLDNPQSFVVYTG